MKIRHPRAIKLASWVGTQIVRTLCGTMRLRCEHIGENCYPDSPSLSGRVIYAFWHECMLVPSFRFRKRDIHVLVSGHSDGRFIAGVLERLGFRTVVGSSKQGGAKAMRRMLRVSERSHIVITPDGPRGPRRKVKSGVIYLAARTGLPIVPVGLACSNAWRAKSWDQLTIPKMFSRGRGVSAPPIFIPPDVSTDTLEPYRQELEEKLHALTEIAERWAATGLYDTNEYHRLPDRARSPSLTYSPR
jgi:lysophospholipid acyltransferase (LPLAT)-like uncharacterized protein